MAELIHTSIEDDDSEGQERKQARKRIDPKKLVNVPFVRPPEVERRVSAEELKRTVEFIPPVFGEVRSKILSESSETEDDDEDEDEESKEGAVESPDAVDQPVEAAEAVVLPVSSEEAAPPSPAEMHELAEEEMAHLREQSNQPLPEVSPVEVAATEPEAEEPPAASTRGSAAPPPAPPPSAPRFFGRPEEPAPPPVYQPSFEAPQESRPTPAFTAERPAVEMSDLDRHTEEERKRNLRLVVVAGVATGLLLKAYIDAKTKGYKEMLEPLKDQVVNMFTGQKRTESRVEKVEQKVEKLVQPVPAESLPPIQQGQEQIFDMEGNPITLLPGQRVERSSGGYSVVLDQHNRVVHDAIHYGEAFKRDQKREQLSPDLFAPVGGGVAAGGPADDFVTSLPSVTGQPSGPAPDLPLAEEHQAPPDSHHPPAPRHNVLWGLPVSWLLTAVAILLIIYFIAALA